MFTVTEIFCLNGKKTPSIPIGTKVVAVRRAIARMARFSGLFLILSFVLVIILSWHAVFPEYISFHVSLAFSQDL